MLGAGTASPLAIEAVQQLAQLGEKEADILNLVGKGVGNQRWLLSLVAARVQQAVSDHKSAATTYAHLAMSFPDNGEVLANLAVCHANTGNQQASLEAFALVRSRDEHYMDNMDCYAEVLKSAGAHALLNQVFVLLVLQLLLQLELANPPAPVCSLLAACCYLLLASSFLLLATCYLLLPSSFGARVLLNQVPLVRAPKRTRGKGDPPGS
jgi:hypothetical protein